MRSLLQNKRLVLLLAVLALAALTILAVGLKGMPFREAQHFAQPEPQVTEAPAVPPPSVPAGIIDWRHLVALTLLILLVVLVGALLSPIFRRRLLRLLFRLAVSGLVIFLMRKQLVEIIAAVVRGFYQFPVISQEKVGPDNASLPPMPAFTPPAVSSTMSYVISFAFAVLLLVLAWVLYRGWKRYMEAMSPSKPLEDIARIARSSLDELSAGRNSSDVIINCYFRMSDAVSNKHKLYREIAMTPREFAERLERAGLPGEAVMQLTRLFEGVRYGDRKSAPREITEAVDCLKTIVQHCGEPA